ncbi:MAG: hypothetical protein LBD47_03275 [Treponema sp.]|jgi:hypothetical protein|nr:hypothetical protein [Treponema sp.]
MLTKENRRDVGYRKFVIFEIKNKEPKEHKLLLTDYYSEGESPENIETDKKIQEMINCFSAMNIKNLKLNS